ncbi:MAG: hypothetical protein FWD45_06160, partial [Coriobacteriia bacterium]|nr:hypothetical protein [Coriobacteriia bacterium]
MTSLALIFNDWRGPILAALLSQGEHQLTCVDLDTTTDQHTQSLAKSVSFASTVSQAISTADIVITALDSSEKAEEIY